VARKVGAAMPGRKPTASSPCAWVPPSAMSPSSSFGSRLALSEPEGGSRVTIDERGDHVYVRVVACYEDEEHEDKDDVRPRRREYADFPVRVSLDRPLGERAVSDGKRKSIRIGSTWVRKHALMPITRDHSQFSGRVQVENRTPVPIPRRPGRLMTLSDPRATA